MTPTLITAPSADVVSLADLKAHLRVTHLAEDTLIASLGAAATAYLDGWTGILGRCIMPQTWQITADSGEVSLPFPDVTTASAAYAAGAAALVPEIGPCGPVVTLTEGCVVTFTCAMPAHLLPAVQMAVKLLVGHWYQNREAAGPSIQEAPLAVAAIVDAMRWHRI